jgi:hypothetical protein
MLRWMLASGTECFEDRLDRLEVGIFSALSRLCFEEMRVNL